MTAGGDDPRLRRDRRLKLVPKTARPPRHHLQSFAEPKGGREKGTRSTQAHQPKRTTQTTQKLQAQHNHPHKRGRNPPHRTATSAQPHGQGRSAKATTTRYQEGREGQERKGRGKGNAGAKENKAPEKTHEGAQEQARPREKESVRASKSARECVRTRDQGSRK